MKTLPALLRMIFAVCMAVTFAATQAHANRDGSTDRPGLDYNSFELSAPNPDLCEAACKKDGKCRAWTYSWPGAKGPKAQCALKTGVPPKRSDTCCISGVLSTSSPVTRTDDPKPAPQQQNNVAEKQLPKVEPAPQPEQKKVEAEKPKIAAPNPVEPETPPEDRKSAEVPKPDSSLETRSEQAAIPAEPDAEERIAAVRPRQRPEDLSTQPDQSEPQDQQADDTPAAPPLDESKVAACRDYATTAISQNRRNRELRCGLRGSRWGYGYDAYFNYCMKSPASAYGAARQARDVELSRCKNRLASRGDVRNDRSEDFLPEVGDIFRGGRRAARFCRKYSLQAARQSREAVFIGCGFGGARWSTSRGIHIEMCEDLGPRKAAKLLRKRARQLDRCRAEVDGGGRVAGFSGGGYCDRYAAIAVSQFRTGLDLDCGFSGPRWSGSYAGHRRWCQQVPRRRSRAEQRIRQRFLARCE